MPTADNRDTRYWTGSLRKSKQLTGKCRSLHLGDRTQRRDSSISDPFRQTKELSPADCISSRHFGVTTISLQVAEPPACSARVRSRSLTPMAAPDTPRSAPLSDHFPTTSPPAGSYSCCGCSRSWAFTSCCPLSSLLKWESA
jgi:hypothetical protein